MKHATISIADRPFALPPRALTTIVVDLPRPPSLNHIWLYSRKGVRPSPAYEKWKAKADKLALLQKIHRGLEPIAGAFEARLYVAEGGRGDADNLAKAPLDWAQSRRLIVNDKHCKRLIIEIVEKARAPEGVRLVLVELA